MATPGDHFDRIYTTPFRPPLSDSELEVDGGSDADDTMPPAPEYVEHPDVQAAAQDTVARQKQKEADQAGDDSLGLSPGARRLQIGNLRFRLPQLLQRAARMVPAYAIERMPGVGEDAAAVADPGTAQQIAALQSQVELIITTVNDIITALNAATVTCNEDDTVTLTIPGIPDPIMS